MSVSNIKAESLVDTIKHLRPCGDAVVWLAKQESPSQTWKDCERGDWMLWIIGKQIKSTPWDKDRKPLLACALDCAELVKNMWNKDQIECVSVLRQWIRGVVTVEQAKKARHDLYAAADAAAYAAAYAADAAARTNILKQSADIVRKHYPTPPDIKL